MKTYILIGAILGVFLFSSSAYTASDDIAGKIASLQSQISAAKAKLAKKDQKISEYESYSNTIKGLQGMSGWKKKVAEGAANKAIEVYLKNEVGWLIGHTSGDFIEQHIHLVDLKDAQKFFDGELKKTQKIKVDLKQQINGWEQEIAQLQDQQRAEEEQRKRDEEYFKDPLDADIKNEENHLAYLRNELKRPMDDFDRKMLEWQIKNTEERIRQLKEQKRKRDQAAAGQKLGNQFGEIQKIRDNEDRRRRQNQLNQQNQRARSSSEQGTAGHGQGQHQVTIREVTPGQGSGTGG